MGFRQFALVGQRKLANVIDKGWLKPSHRLYEQKPAHL